MFKSKFDYVDYNGKYVIIYKKWYNKSWYTLEYNNDPYKFDNEDAVKYMIKCLEEASL